MQGKGMWSLLPTDGKQTVQGALPFAHALHPRTQRALKYLLNEWVTKHVPDGVRKEGEAALGRESKARGPRQGGHPAPGAPVPQPAEAQGTFSTEKSGPL